MKINRAMEGQHVETGAHTQALNSPLRGFAKPLEDFSTSS
jgi:hypothetical protein